MINLGPYSGRNASNVKLPLTVTDIILEGLIGVIFFLAVLLLVWFIAQPVPVPWRLWGISAALIIFSLFLPWACRAPIRYYRFPVRLTAHNYIMQYFLATRFLRVIGVLANLLMLIQMCVLVELIDIKILSILNFITLILLVGAFVVYYVFALCNR